MCTMTRGVQGRCRPFTTSQRDASHAPISRVAAALPAQPAPLLHAPLPVAYSVQASPQGRDQLSTRLMRPVSAPAALQEAGSTGQEPASAARQRVLELLAAGHTNHAPHPDMPAVVEALIRSSTAADPAPATFRLGQGVWEVFYAPHIRTISSIMGTRFEPVRYTLEGSELYSNVGYKLPLGAGGGWLNAAGDMGSRTADTLELHFNRFWVDRGGEPLRPNITAETASQGWDGFISQLGRAFFFDGLASFPVQYVDDDLTVFRFPPLNVSIAAQRVG